MKPTGSEVVDAAVDAPAPRRSTEEPAAGPAPVATDAEVEPAPVEPPLTQRELDMLAFEGKWWKHAGAKEQAIRDAFELSATRYYQLLNALLDKPAALAHDPVVVGRLRRLRSTRARSRPGRVPPGR
ncbi:MAG TPA: DUF3263 domain-containing protein [Pilimelia sp.]|nr:DUF3263 domain-containing protein [Pilimelia sp.]